MSNKKKQQKQQMKLALQDISNKLSEEIWEDKWDHIPGIQTKPIGECTEILQELERRCPGHTLEEYKDAIARSMFTWR
jgi:hypothetical protein